MKRKQNWLALVPVEQRKTCGCASNISEHKLCAAVLNSYEDVPEVHAVADAHTNDVPTATDSTQLNKKLDSVHAIQNCQFWSRARHQPRFLHQGATC